MLIFSPLPIKRFCVADDEHTPAGKYLFLSSLLSRCMTANRFSSVVVFLMASADRTPRIYAVI